MKYVNVFIVMVFSMLLTSCGEISNYFQDPVTHNDSIIDIYNFSVEEYVAYDTYYLETSWEYFDKIEERRESTIQTIKASIVELNMLEPLKGDNSLIDAAVESMEVIINVLETHDKQLLMLWSDIVNEVITEEQYDIQTQESVDLATKELDDASENFDIVHNVFAKKYGYELSDVE